uniref:Uncharacterized protein n=1 Tax=Siphoviridae sp. ct3r22 TaxID=2825325 RepID=A0A8S5V0Y5_9CAUD|nr:MAG TPA: hypothetical protein [Siphoviridae sp. ct3r22]
MVNKKRKMNQLLSLSTTLDLATFIKVYGSFLQSLNKNTECYYFFFNPSNFSSREILNRFWFS